MAVDPTHFIAVDLARLWTSPEQGRKLLRVLTWGDEVVALAETDRYHEVRATHFVEKEDGSIAPVQGRGYLLKDGATDILKPIAENRVLRVSFVDVQQGDGTLLESPFGEVILIDGGDNQLFARYLAGRFPGTSERRPQDIDCLLVTHGDADHFVGLAKIQASEDHANPRKRLFIRPRRVYHNGLVKGPSSRDGQRVPDAQLLGQTHQPAAGKPVITELHDDLLAVPAARMNRPFQAWRRALQHWQKRLEDGERIVFRRLAKGDDAAFDFFTRPFAEQGDAPCALRVLGPILTTVDGQTGLKFLGDPPKGPRAGPLPDAPQATEFPGLSAGHTINGHSVILHLTYGAFRFLFAGDLNEEAEAALTAAHRQGEIDLEADVFKVPHHGSADFSLEFLGAVAPVVSVVSSGDESARKEFIHPRATLMGALGKASRLREPLIFVTELVAFFQAEDYVTPECHESIPGAVAGADGTVTVRELDRKKRRPRFYAFRRAAFGLVKVRTDGKRLLVVTDSANVGLKEAYRFEMTDGDAPQICAARVRQV